MMSRILSGVLLALLWFPVAGHGEDAPQPAKQGAGNSLSPLPMLSSDEPNRLGCTRDSYERSCFMDFVLSLRYPLFYEAMQQGHKFNMLPFLSFTGRMGQYSGTVRHSSPVVTKQFNPKLFFRFYTSYAEGQLLGSTDDKQDFYDVGYAHESNGQYVDSVPLFDSTAASVGGADIAQDYISRGWDYLNYKRHLHFDVLGTNSLDVELRYFLSYGLLQKGSEEYFPWEAPRAITRISQVDGIRLKVNRDLNWNWFKGADLSFTTGYRNFARWNTFRAELGFTPLSDLMGLPIVLWGQAGYNSSVTQYYRNAWSVGLAAAFETYR
jgi:hypothetical protein